MDDVSIFETQGDDFMWFHRRDQHSRKITLNVYRFEFYFILFESINESDSHSFSYSYLYIYTDFAPSDQNVFHPPFMYDNKSEITLVITSMDVVYE